MPNNNIIFEGDFVKDPDDGIISEVIEITDWDDSGDAELHLANGRVISSDDLTMDDILLASEI